MANVISTDHPEGLAGNLGYFEQPDFMVPGVVGLVELPDVDLALPVAEALASGGVRCIEVALRTSAAVDSLRLIRSAFPDLLVGAGTVLTLDQLAEVIDAGAGFVVSPGFNPRVVERCLELGLPILPGVATPTEIDMALACDIRVVKLFPMEALGGLAYLKALSAPYRDVRFVPTGGISPSNLVAYLATDCVLACGGSWMTPRDLLSRGDFSSIRRLAEETVAIARRPPRIGTVASEELLG